MIRQTILLLISVFVGCATTAAETGSMPSKFFGLIYSKVADGLTQADTTTAKNIARELRRPCDETEFMSWKSSNPKDEQKHLSSEMVGILTQNYAVMETTNYSHIAKQVAARVFVANTKEGDSHLTAIWSTSNTEVVLAVCGASAAMLGARHTLKNPPDSEIIPKIPGQLKPRNYDDEWTPPYTRRGPTQIKKPDSTEYMFKKVPFKLERSEPPEKNN